MPYLIVCPNCGSKLKAAQPVPAGRNLTCPQCKAAFTLSEPAPEVDAASLPTPPAKPATAEAPAVAAPRPAPAPAPTPPAKPRSVTGALDAFSAAKGRSADGDVRDAEVVDDRPRARRRDEDEDDRPRSRRREDDDEDDRPRARRGRHEDEEEDERPRARRGRDEDEDEDERPKARRRGRDEDDEEEDERPSARRRRGEDDEDEERPKGRRGRAEDDEDEDERPKSRRGRDEDDEEDESGRPKARRRRDDDEDEDEDERPKGRRVRDEDKDEDERPRGRRGRDEDDEEEDERPSRRKGRAAADDEDEDKEDDRPRRGRGKKKKNKGLMIGLLAGAALLFLLGGAILILVDPFGVFGGGAASSDMLAWMPAETQSIEGVDYNEVSKNPKALSSVRQDLRDAETIGLKAEDVASSIQAKKPGKGAAEVTVLKMKSAPDKDKIIKTAGSQEATANGKKYYKTNWGGGLYFASDKLVVLTRSESTMTSLLQKEDGKVVISKELQDCVKRADGHLWMAAVGSDANIFGGGAGGDMGKGGFPGFAAPPAAKSALMTAKVSGDEVTIKMEFTYADADTAKKAGDAIEGMFKKLKELMGAFGGKGAKGGIPDAKMQEMQKMFDSMKVSTSGNTVTITMKGPIDSMDGFGKGFGGM
jgi:hypothetical protein